MHILYVQKLVADTGQSAVVIPRPIAIAARTRTLLVSCWYSVPTSCSIICVSIDDYTRLASDS